MHNLHASLKDYASCFSQMKNAWRDLKPMQDSYSKDLFLCIKEVNNYSYRTRKLAIALTLHQKTRMHWLGGR